MRTTIELDDDLVREAFELTGARPKRELVHLALTELVKARRQARKSSEANKNLLDLAGRVQFYEGYNYKSVRQ